MWWVGERAQDDKHWLWEKKAKAATKAKAGPSLRLNDAYAQDDKPWFSRFIRLGNDSNFHVVRAWRSIKPLYLLALELHLLLT